MVDVNMTDIEKLLAKGQELKQFLRENPEVLEFLRLAAKTTLQNPIIIPPDERYIHAGEVAKILCIDKGAVYRLEKAGRLTAYYVGDASRMKFKLSDVLAVPHMKEVNAR